MLSEVYAGVFVLFCECSLKDGEFMVLPKSVTRPFAALMAPIQYGSVSKKGQIDRHKLCMFLVLLHIDPFLARVGFSVRGRSGRCLTVF